jgi:hypothetical protein
MAGTRFGLSSKNTLEQLTNVDNHLVRKDDVRNHVHGDCREHKSLGKW